jgi:hypothetical protein
VHAERIDENLKVRLRPRQNPVTDGT